MKVSLENRNKQIKIILEEQEFNGMNKNKYFSISRYPVVRVPTIILIAVIV